MSNNLKNVRANDRQGTLVIEFEVSALRAAWMAFNDQPGKSQPDPTSVAGDDSSASTARFRVVVSELGSDVDVYFHDYDVVGAEHWERLSDGVSFSRLPGVTFWRRMIVAEAFRRLAADGTRQVVEATTRARVVGLGVEPRLTAQGTCTPQLTWRGWRTLARQNALAPALVNLQALLDGHQRADLWSPLLASLVEKALRAYGTGTPIEVAIHAELENFVLLQFASPSNPDRFLSDLAKDVAVLIVALEGIAGAGVNPWIGDASDRASTGSDRASRA